MLLRYSFDQAEPADLVEKAVSRVLDEGYRTADIMQDGMSKVGTAGMGDVILKELDRQVG